MSITITIIIVIIIVIIIMSEDPQRAWGRSPA